MKVKPHRDDSPKNSGSPGTSNYANSDDTKNLGAQGNGSDIHDCGTYSVSVNCSTTGLPTAQYIMEHFLERFGPRRDQDATSQLKSKLHEPKTTANRDPVLCEYMKEIKSIQDELDKLFNKNSLNEIAENNLKEIAAMANTVIKKIEQDQTIGYSSEKADLYLTAKKVLIKLGYFKKDLNAIEKALVKRVSEDLAKEHHPLKLNSLTWLTAKGKSADELKISLSRFKAFLEIVLFAQVDCSAATAKKNIENIFTKEFELNDNRIQQISTRLNELVRGSVITQKEANQLGVSLAEILYLSQGKLVASGLLSSFPEINSKKLIKSFSSSWQKP